MTTMVIFPSRGDDALDEFVRLLDRFKLACCVPSNRELVKLAPHVGAKHKHLRLCHLSAPALSDVLSRKRHRPPRWEWVATYVLTCLHVHEGSGAELNFDGPRSLQGWYELYQEKFGDPHASGGRARAPMDGPVPASPVGPSGPPGHPEGPVPPLPASRVLHWQDLHDAALEDWMHRFRRQHSMTHRRYYELLGRHGVDLLMAAEGAARDREAACRLGILLLCHDRPNEGMAWLRSAAGDGDEPARILVNAAPSRRREMAAELAYEFTLPGYAQEHPTGDGRPTAAEVYYRAAAAAGHMGATVRLGLILEARGEIAEALCAYARAAARCHPDGLRHCERLNDQIIRDPSVLRPEDLPPES
ncbi:hypothetical protein GCM10023085_21360 [Actinomadura viridis]|uniref:Sel1 repeat family protein n=1 Tax=Actinomadura viridis TaxID=58110 RepID=A0A931DHW4_9ACTN|nr:hypothetical protein [Actinomadura viridis]MBG6088512.1 hypothetical protein [Actinomadura viridis]